ncbi:SRPBCC domain-containing protein [Kytococcus sp. Marseille-QA3725]
MDAVQHVDAVTRRVEQLGAGWLLSLGRVLPGRPRELWRSWATPQDVRAWWPLAEAPARWEPGAEFTDGSGTVHVVERCEEPELLRLVLRRDGVESFVAVDLAVDGGQTVLTVQHALPDGDPAGLGTLGVGWDRVLWGLAGQVERTRGEDEGLPPREDEAERAAAELWEVAFVQAGLGGR